MLALLFVAVYTPTILNEERYLRGKFPGFDAYTREVPRFLPRLTPAHLGGAGEFSRALYLKHKEYNAPLGAGRRVRRARCAPGLEGLEDVAPGGVARADPVSGSSFAGRLIDSRPPAPIGPARVPPLSDNRLVYKRQASLTRPSNL